MDSSGQLKVHSEAIGEILRRQPGVRDVAVKLGDGSAELVAYVVPAGESSADSAHTAKWKKLSEFSYSHLKDAPADAAVGGDFNLAGWKSSYTGQSVEQAEMAEWVDETVRRILSLRPKRVLEIGCGTGLLLFRIAPTCEQYWATDISQSVTKYVQRHVEANPALGHVKVWQAEASNLGDVPAGQFDVVVINSVIQYFPGAAYLTQVINQAARTLRPGGVVLVGDVRNFDLLEAFHLSVLLANAKDTDTVGELRANLRNRLEAEPELAVSPAFFATLPGFSAEIEPRRGRFLNEMTRFRYNALLRVGDPSGRATKIDFQDWLAGGWTIDRLRQKLSEQPASLAFTGVPDARTCESVAFLAVFDGEEDSKSIGAFRNGVSPPRIGVDPEDLWKLESEFPYQVQIGCAQPALLDVLIQRRDNSAAMSIPAPTPSPGSALTNDPAKNRRNQALVSQLLRALKTELPAHIAAPRVVAVDALPSN